MTTHSYRPHPSDKLQQVFEKVEQYGAALSRIAAELGLTIGQVAGIKRRHREEWDAALRRWSKSDGSKPADGASFDEEVTTRQEGGTVEFKSKSQRIKTVEDLLAHVNADLENYEVVSFEATSNEVVTKDPTTGDVTVTPYHRVWAKLKLKAGIPWMDLAEVMIQKAITERGPRKAPAVRVPDETAPGTWQVLVIADPHFGKYSWRGTTGYEDYDLNIAQQHVLGSAIELMERADHTYRPTRRTIAFLGDVFHYDTPQGTTTGGTPLERDGRMPKMVDIGTDTIMEIITWSSSTADTDVLFVRGNHDEALTTFLQKMIATVFEDDPRVTVDRSHTHRKYLYHEGTLLGFTHGDKAKKHLAAIMPHEAKEHWGNSTYYEFHTGHTHAMKAEWARPVETIDGVLVRVAPAICPPDDWHSDHGFVGSLRAMESFIYRPGGGLLGSLLSSPQYTTAGVTR